MTHYELISIAQRVRLAKYLIEHNQGDQAAEILRNVGDWIMIQAEQQAEKVRRGTTLFGDALLDEARKLATRF